MKKIAVIFVVFFLFALMGCNSDPYTSKFESKVNDIGASDDIKADTETQEDIISDNVLVDIGEKGGIAYFKCSEEAPEIILKGENETAIKDADFFAALVDSIDGKRIIKDICNCEATYVLRIGSYTIGLHTHSINIYKGDSIKFKDLIAVVCECTEEEINELFGFLEAYDKGASNG